VLDLTYTDEDTGNADVGVGIGVMDVLRAYTGKDPSLRIIGANMTGSANYWYVAATSPIKKVKDISFRSIAYSKADQYDMFDFLDRFGLKARPVLTSGETAAFDQVMAGKIDVGWATPRSALTHSRRTGFASSRKRARSRRSETRPSA
jgi:NMT1/THI5 like